MKNLEKIKAALSMGWLAKIVCPYMGNETIVIGPLDVGGTTTLLLRNGHQIPVHVYRVNDYEIKSWIYGGQFVGNEIILELQMFKIKSNGRVMDFSTLMESGYDKEEIEPVFD